MKDSLKTGCISNKTIRAKPLMHYDPLNIRVCPGLNSMKIVGVYWCDGN